MFRNKDYIYCVYKEQSFVRAAEKLHVSQPALSAMIKRIETQLGMPVFDRKTTPISLTPFGAEYIKNIEIVQTLEENLRTMTYEFQTYQGGQLSICASNLNVDYYIPELIAQFKKQFPKIKLNVIGANTHRSKRMLDLREIDFFIATKPLDEQEYHRVPISREQLVLIVPKVYEINQAFAELALTRKTLRHIFEPSVRGVPLSAFRSLPFILSNTENYLRNCTDTLFHEAQFEPEIALEVDESGTAPNFAKYGIGATIAPHFLIARTDFEKYFCVYKLDSQYTERIGYVNYRKGVYVTPAMAKFLELASQTSCQ